MTISQVDRGGSNAGGFETDRECKALIDPSVPQMCEKEKDHGKHTPQGRCQRRAQFYPGALVSITRYSQCGTREE